MTTQRAFRRKVVYLVIMVALVPLLFWLGQPPAPGVRGEKGSPGGVLSQLRNEYGLSQAQLGQLDPASETIKLATLGLRGVATVLLWEKADEYKMKKDWTNLAATLNQLIKVQPNFASVWRFQGWNLSYNVSVEFDDYRQRYHWVIKGIEFLQDGIEYNRREPILKWDVGWFISQKIGRADEWKQYRRLFKADDDFHDTRALPDDSDKWLIPERDNWLVGKEWYHSAERLVDAGNPVRSSPLVFRADAPMCQMNYAEALEKDGTFGEKAKQKWREAAEEWHAYGSLDLPASENVFIRLNDQETHQARAKQLAAELDAMEPGLREKIKAEKLAALPKDQREARDVPEEKRDGNQADLASQAEAALVVSHDEVARRITGSQRRKALNMATEALNHEDLARKIARDRDIVNFNYWRTRAEVEQTDEAVTARKAIYDGDEAFAQADVALAWDCYERGLAEWRKVLDKFPQLVTDTITGQDLMDVIRRYRQILRQNDAPFPKPFILDDIIKLHDKEQ